MRYKYKPIGVCSKEFVIDIDNNKVTNLKVIGGCPGNTLGISVLIKNMEIDTAISKLRGIKCGLKSTSCPDQIARALTSIKEEIEESRVG